MQSEQSDKPEEMQSMEKTIGAHEARRKFGQRIKEAFYKRDILDEEPAGGP